MTCDSVARARFTKVIGGSGGVNAISYYLESKSTKNHEEIRQKSGGMRGGGCELCIAQGVSEQLSKTRK